MTQENRAGKGDSRWMNIGIIFLLVVLAFLLFQLLSPKKGYEPALSGQEAQESMLLTPEPVSQEAALNQELIATVPVSAAAAGKFAIQVGAFQDKTRAEALAEKLKASGQAPVMETKDLGVKGIWYRVYVGGFETQAEAQGLLESVRKDHPGAFIKER